MVEEKLEEKVEKFEFLLPTGDTNTHMTFPLPDFPGAVGITIIEGEKRACAIWPRDVMYQVALALLNRLAIDEAVPQAILEPPAQEVVN